ncbi:MAG: phytoene desaturase family protein [Longimicrobiales bacterium]
MTYDAVVVGAGPNGLAAAVELQRNGCATLLIEAADTVGGASRTEEVTLPGFLHDVGSAIHPLGVGSPFFSSLPLESFGLEWVHPETPLAHPLPDGTTAILERDLHQTSSLLGDDGRTWTRMFGPFVDRWPAFAEHVLRSPLSMPRAPILMARFASFALRSTPGIARAFRGEAARALLAGNAAHAGTPLTHALTGAVGATLIVAAHAVGWPFPRGGAGALTGALARYFRSLGGTIETGHEIRSLEDVPRARVTLLALTHGQVAALNDSGLPDRFRARLARWRYGPGAFKVDWALDAPIPWRDPTVARAATVHIGGTLSEIMASEAAPLAGHVSERPFVLLSQPSLFDPARAPEGKHTAWAYCHVPNGWTGDATKLIESQIERFAPGFRDRVLARASWDTERLEQWNGNLVGGDVNGGVLTLGQTIGTARWGVPGYRTPRPDLYLCSASTPPGGGVHGMAGYHAARAALKHSLGLG